jgi:2-keto-4-pentenoate hydratase
MDHTQEALLDWVESQIFGSESPKDVLERAPNLTPAEAYRLRDALMRRRAAQGDRHVGYKVGGASRTMRAQEHVEGPMVGCLMQSSVFSESQPIAVEGYARSNIEAEIGVLLKGELAGPGLTLQDVLPAIEAVFPAFELIRSRGGSSRSQQMRILSSNFTGGVVIGGPMTSLQGIDLRLEGMVLTLNGEVQGSATGVEVLGNPLNAVALVANTIGEYGARLEAGMIIMTGSFIGNLKVKPGDCVRARYTRIGSVNARFA